ncbi:hypothetical protein [Thermococcus sp. ES12]|uniref:hypothetical protein n=1 Tax=Thermococcus sp. ES12 TaxID=1638246 RepID=UPI0014319A0C|nr:hypothetical protein [Thermococcus sp. ES12]NJE75961.1 hypothetical protein [Thermococcus sp. ES12]
MNKWRSFPTWDNTIDFFPGIIQWNLKHLKIQKKDPTLKWITDNYAIIPASKGRPLQDPWGILAEYIYGWYEYRRIKPVPGGRHRILHISILMDNYGVPATITLSLNGSPPKGRLLIELIGSQNPQIAGIIFIGSRVKAYRAWDMDRLPIQLRHALTQALTLLL